MGRQQEGRVNSGKLKPTLCAALLASSAFNPPNTGAFNPDNFPHPTTFIDSHKQQHNPSSALTISSNTGHSSLVSYCASVSNYASWNPSSMKHEAVGPFIQREGLAWVLPLHETVETFLAGTIFAVASTFTLVGSTKIVSMLVTYIDVFLCAPFRLFGGFAFDRARGKPVTLDLGVGPFKKRVIGQGIPKDEKKVESIKEQVMDLGNVDTKELPIVVLSGGVTRLWVKRPR